MGRWNPNQGNGNGYWEQTWAIQGSKWALYGNFECAVSLDRSTHFEHQQFLLHALGCPVHQLSENAESLKDTDVLIALSPSDSRRMTNFIWQIFSTVYVHLYLTWNEKN